MIQFVGGRAVGQTVKGDELRLLTYHQKGLVVSVTGEASCPSILVPAPWSIGSLLGKPSWRGPTVLQLFLFVSLQRKGSCGAMQVVCAVLLEPFTVDSLRGRFSPEICAHGKLNLGKFSRVM
jgi:hypothetical protein